MAILYKLFNAFRTALCGCFFCLCAIGPANTAFASGPLFTVENVQVDVTAANAIAAREKAFEEAQVKAFEELSRRMTAGDTQTDVQAPDPLTISTLIQDFEITAEKLSAVRYIGTYTFRFKDSAVRNYFAGRGMAYTDVGSRPLLVLPFYQRPDAPPTLWSPDNIWMQGWSTLRDLDGLVPLVVPLGDLADIRDIGDDEALTYRANKLLNMLGRYGASEAVIVIAVPDQALAESSKMPDSPAQGRLNIHIYRTDRAGPELVLQMEEHARTGQSTLEFYEQAARKIQRALQKDWKAKTLVDAAEGKSVVRARIRFDSLEEWASTQRLLERTDGIDNISLLSLSPQTAYVDIAFQGPQSRLRLALKQAGITLSTGSATSEIGGEGTPPIYDLSLNRFQPRY